MKKVRANACLLWMYNRAVSSAPHHVKVLFLTKGSNCLVSAKQMSSILVSFQILRRKFRIYSESLTDFARENTLC
jgi:UDP-N-acetylenolpyruvoylglucosamine reductase